MNLSKKRIQSLTEQIKRIADQFYQQNQAEAFQAFTGVLNELSELANLLFQKKQMDAGFMFDEQHFLKVLTDGMNALETKDEVLLADILNYDLIEILEGVEKQL